MAMALSTRFVQEVRVERPHCEALEHALVHVVRQLSDGCRKSPRLGIAERETAFSTRRRTM